MDLIFRTLLVYLLTIFAIRMTGKKQLGELQPSELVCAILISNLASVSIESPDLPFSTGILPAFVIACAEILISALCVRFPHIGQVLSGRPRMIIRNGTIDQKALRDLRFTADDLMQALHSKDVFDLSEVAFAVVERNGTLSIAKKFSCTVPVNQSFHFTEPAACQPFLPLISDGILNRDNIVLCGTDEDWVLRECQKKSLSADQILLFLCNDAHDIFIIKKESR